MEQIFTQYPKIRPDLPPAYQAIYAEHYKSNREGETTASGLAQWLESWLHKNVAADVVLSKDDLEHFHKTLEIGAGTLNQLAYEIPAHYDIIEPFTELYKNSPSLDLVQNTYVDIDEIDTAEQYDRIISVATLEHVVDLPKVVAKSCLLLAEGGSFRNSIPNEGRFLFKLGWQLTTGLEFKMKHKLDYEVLMKHEHVNTADEIEEVLHYFFKVNKCKVLGPNKAVSFYRFYESTQPDLARAKAYLAQSKSH